MHLNPLIFRKYPQTWLLAPPGPWRSSRDSAEAGRLPQLPNLGLGRGRGLPGAAARPRHRGMTRWTRTPRLCESPRTPGLRSRAPGSLWVECRQQQPPLLSPSGAGRVGQSRRMRVRPLGAKILLSPCRAERGLRGRAAPQVHGGWGDSVVYHRGRAGARA